MEEGRRFRQWRRRGCRTWGEGAGWLVRREAQSIKEVEEEEVWTEVQAALLLAVGLEARLGGGQGSLPGGPASAPPPAAAAPAPAARVRCFDTAAARALARDVLELAEVARLGDLHTAGREGGGTGLGDLHTAGREGGS